MVLRGEDDIADYLDRFVNGLPKTFNPRKFYPEDWAVLARLAGMRVDGEEELYDCLADPNEWRTLASAAGYDRIKPGLGRWIPKTSAPPKPVRADYDFDFATY